MASPLHPISIHNLHRGKVYHVSHHGGPLRAAKVTADMHEELPGGFMPGGITVVFSYQPYDGAFIAEGDKSYKFYGKEGPRAPAPSPRRSSSARRSSARRKRMVSRVRRTKSAPRHHR